MVRRVLCLCTGGTICMQDSADGLTPSAGILPQLLKRLARNDLQLEIIEYENLIDSSSINISHWNQLIIDIERNYTAYDAFVIVHGTDTMAYSASALAFALRGLSKPVVFTGAQLPLLHPHSDGWINLNDALSAAVESDLSEVVIVFNRLMLRGCRARKVDASSFNSFASPNFPPLANFELKTVWHRELWLQPQGEFCPVKFEAQIQVWMLMLAPGASAGLFGEQLAKQKPHGAIFLAYGNGNIPNDQALLEGVNIASANGSIIMVLTQALRGQAIKGAYAASSPLSRSGAIFAADITPEAALAKLSMLGSMSLPLAKAKEWLLQNIAGEMSA